MEFKKLNLRGVFLLALAGLALLITIIIRMGPHGPIPEQSVKPVESNQPSPVRLTNNIREVKALAEEETPSMKEMKEQMDKDRLQQKKIKMLKLQLEQTNLQLEQEKALSEINKLEKENTSVVNVSNDGVQDKYPDIKVIYIGGTADSKAAILSINGNNYSVKEKNKPFKNMQVLSITDTGVVIHFDLPQDLTTTVEYKPE